MRLRFLASLAVMIVFLSATVAVPTASAAPMGDRTNVPFSAGGLSSQYHLYASGVDTSKQVGLLLQFHGDGAYEFHNPSSSYSLGGPNGIVAKAREHNLITVPVLSPDKVGSVTWWESGSANADYVKALLAHVRSEYPMIRSDRIWLVGYSGGSEFLTRFYLPRHSDTIAGGGAIMFGGGGVPFGTVRPFAEALRAGFPLHWYTGLDDDGRNGSYNALRDARAASAWYRDRGFAVELETPAGVNHGLSGQFGPLVGTFLAKHAKDAAAPSPAPAPAPAPEPAPAPAPSPAPAPEPAPAPAPSPAPAPAPAPAPEPAPTPAPSPAPAPGPAPAPEPAPKPTRAPGVTDVEVVRTNRGMVFTGRTAAGTGTVVLRASTSPLRGQTGWYLPRRPARDGTVTIELTKLRRDKAYHWQLETRSGTVLVSGRLPAAVPPRSSSRRSGPAVSRAASSAASGRGW